MFALPHADTLKLRRLCCRPRPCPAPCVVLPQAGARQEQHVRRVADHPDTAGQVGAGHLAGTQGRAPRPRAQSSPQGGAALDHPNGAPANRRCICAPAPAAQGIWLCEHRDSVGGRKLIVTLQGATG